MFDTEMIDKLFLELSQVTRAKTKKELDLQYENQLLKMGISRTPKGVLVSRDKFKEYVALDKKLDKALDKVKSLEIALSLQEAANRILQDSLNKLTGRKP